MIGLLLSVTLNIAKLKSREIAVELNVNISGSAFGFEGTSKKTIDIC